MKAARIEKSMMYPPIFTIISKEFIIIVSKEVCSACSGLFVLPWGQKLYALRAKKDKGRMGRYRDQRSAAAGAGTEAEGIRPEAA